MENINGEKVNFNLEVILKQKKVNETPEIVVPKGYDLFDLIDTDDKGYDFGKPILIEEVKLRFEREQTE